LAPGPPTADEILNQYRAANKANQLVVEQYTDTSKTTHIHYDGKGRETSRDSETYDFMFLEGAPYAKLIARNDQPLSAAENAKEDEKLKRTAEERRAHEHTPFTQRNVHMASIADTQRLDSCKIAGEEEIGQRKAWIIQCDPQPGLKPANKAEKEKLSTNRRLWINQKDHMLVKLVDTALEGNPTMTPGSTITNQYKLINNEAWCMVSSIIEGHLKIAGMIHAQVRTEYSHTNFKKFAVQSTVTPSPQ
jgi:hypothetical protein